jgi:hypothetical protein
MGARVQLAYRIDARSANAGLHPGGDCAGAQSQDADALRAILLVSRAGERQDGGLGCAVMAPAFQRACSGTGTDVDECPASAWTRLRFRAPLPVLKPR